MSSSECCTKGEDFISNVPGNVADEILAHLPILTAARTSVLSQQWRRNWLSLRRLVFDEKFWYRNKTTKWLKCSLIISSILLLHDGPIHEFVLYIPEDAPITIAPWLSFLAKNSVRKITIHNDPDVPPPINSHIFWCSELEHLKLSNFALNPPPTGFKGFSRLEHLDLCHIDFANPDMFCNLIAKCHQLLTLSLVEWTGMDCVVIDAPSLRRLTIHGKFECLAFKSVRSLESISVSMKRPKQYMAETIENVCDLASSCQLQCIQFNGVFSKLLAAGGITRSHPVAFNHLQKLCLSDLLLEDFSVSQYVFGMIESCPRIQELDISVVTGKIAEEYKVEYNKDHKMSQLYKIKITGITGSSAELKLIEYLLIASEVLEEMLLGHKKFDTVAELKVSRALMGFRRASPMARVLYMD